MFEQIKELMDAMPEEEREELLGKLYQECDHITAIVLSHIGKAVSEIHDSVKALDPVHVQLVSVISSRYFSNTACQYMIRSGLPKEIGMSYLSRYWDEAEQEIRQHDASTTH